MWRSHDRGARYARVFLRKITEGTRFGTQGPVAVRMTEAQTAGRETRRRQEPISFQSTPQSTFMVVAGSIPHSTRFPSTVSGGQLDDGQRLAAKRYPRCVPGT